MDRFRASLKSPVCPVAAVFQREDVTVTRAQHGAPHMPSESWRDHLTLSHNAARPASSPLSPSLETAREPPRRQNGASFCPALQVVCDRLPPSAERGSRCPG